MSQFATVHELSILEAAEKIASKIMAADEHVRKILGDGPEEEVWTAFTAGYAEFYLHTPRYRLQELLFGRITPS